MTPRPARDLQLLDAVDAFRREPVGAEVWRVVRDGRDPVLGSPSLSRWGNGTFDVLYTSFERDGALAEIHSLLSLQPVFPSRLRWRAHKLRVSCAQSIRLADPPDSLAARRGRRSLRGSRLCANPADRRRSLFSRLRRIDHAKCPLDRPQPRPVHGPHSSRAHRSRGPRRRTDRLGQVAQTNAPLIEVDPGALHSDGLPKSC